MKHKGGSDCKFIDEVSLLDCGEPQTILQGCARRETGQLICGYGPMTCRELASYRLDSWDGRTHHL